MKWHDLKDKPRTYKYVLARCSDWNDSGYQVAYWNGKEFAYDEQPNDTFDECVQSWAYIEA